VFVFRFVYWDGAMRLSLSQPPLVVLRGILWGGLFLPSTSFPFGEPTAQTQVRGREGLRG
jgi:hypothetical protein